MIQVQLENHRTHLETAFQFAQRQVRNLIERHPDFYPIYTMNGRWKHEGPAWTHWCTSCREGTRRTGATGSFPA